MQGSVRARGEVVKKPTPARLWALWGHGGMGLSSRLSMTSHPRSPLSRRWVCALALVSFLVAGCATSTRTPSILPPVAGAGPSLRVMTFNIKSGEAGLERIAAVIRAAQPDVVALQEVDNGTRRCGGIDQAQALARLANLPWAVHVATTRLHGGDYGMALISRHPIRSLQRRRLPVDPGMEPRVVARAILDVDGTEISIYKVHLSPLPQRSRLRAEQAAIVARMVARERRPTIVLGDMNDVASSPAVRLLTRNLQDAWAEAGVGDAGTYPLPLLGSFRYDYVLASEAFEVRRAFVIAGDASDHHPVVADLALPATHMAEAPAVPVEHD